MTAPRTCLICKHALDEEMKVIRGQPSRVFCARKTTESGQPVPCESERLGIAQGHEGGRCGDAGLFWEAA